MLTPGQVHGLDDCLQYIAQVQPLWSRRRTRGACSVPSGLGMVCWRAPLIFHRLMMIQGAIYRLAIPVELALRTLFDLEDSDDPRHLSLALTDCTRDCCRVCSDFIYSRNTANFYRLPGTPLWLASVYTDSFGVMNKYWVPPMW